MLANSSRYSVKKSETKQIIDDYSSSYRCYDYFQVNKPKAWWMLIVIVSRLFNTIEKCLSIQQEEVIIVMSVDIVHNIMDQIVGPRGIEEMFLKESIE